MGKVTVKVRSKTPDSAERVLERATASVDGGVLIVTQGADRWNGYYTDVRVLYSPGYWLSAVEES